MMATMISKDAGVCGVDSHAGAVDPFGFWPHRASAIRGLGGLDARGMDGYVFHTNYLYPATGAVRFRIVFEGLTASRGDLAIDLMSNGPTMKVRRRRMLRVPLATIAAKREPLVVDFRCRPGSSYALYAKLLGESDALASGVSVDLDRWSDGREFRQDLRRAKGTVFGTLGKKGFGFLKAQRAVDRHGLLSTTPATLHAPASQVCTDAQFDEPDTDRLLRALGIGKTRHRKLWEFLYILRVLETAGVLKPGARGLGFGIGAEMLPAYFASMGIDIVATDLPADDRIAQAWASTGQHLDNLATLHYPHLCSREHLDRHVTFRSVDMNAIPDDLEGFDFCWSACAFEHLGSIAAGTRFFRNSMRCLKPGGVAVHTTELNLVSNRRTVKTGSTVLFRRRDMEALAVDLRRDGHEVRPLKYDQGDRPVDTYVDLPPYSLDKSQKLVLGSFVTTSFGMAATRAA